MLTQRGWKKTTGNTLRANLTINQDFSFITPGLSAKVSYAYDAVNYSVEERARNINFFEATGRDQDGELIRTEWQADQKQEYLNYKQSGNGSRTQYVEAAINYSRTFGEKHEVGGLLLGFAKDYRLQEATSDYLKSLPNRSLGLAGRLTYAYDKRYLIEANIGFNGSENFAKGKRMGVFPAVAIGWVALGITLICAIVAVGAAIACRSEAGRIAVMHLMEKFPATRPAMEQLAVSRFASALAAYTASGINTDEAMRRAIEVVEHEGLKVKATAAYGLMIDAESPRSLAQAISEAEVFEQIHARLLTIGTRSGSLDAALDRLSANFFDDAILQIDAAIDNIEPALAAFLTIAVGATLISVMLPLIGIMGSIG